MQQQQSSLFCTIITVMQLELDWDISRVVGLPELCPNAAADGVCLQMEQLTCSQLASLYAPSCMPAAIFRFVMQAARGSS